AGDAERAEEHRSRSDLGRTGIARSLGLRVRRVRAHATDYGTAVLRDPRAQPDRGDGRREAPRRCEGRVDREGLAGDHPVRPPGLEERPIKWLPLRWAFSLWYSEEARKAFSVSNTERTRTRVG